MNALKEKPTEHLEGLRHTLAWMLGMVVAELELRKAAQ
jgi:hypothetical protein